MNYNEFQQEQCYNERIGKVYGCFEVIDIEYDPAIRKQVWTLWCVHCGFTKQTHNGKEYVKGKNKGICQCQRHRAISENFPKIKKEKMSDHELYSRWEGIKRRCLYSGDPNYPNYGGRGIKICDEWRYDFWSFVSWAESHGYQKELTIDRIDVDGDYCPENCRWVTIEDQQKNKRNIQLYDGLTLPDYCAKNNLNYGMISRRIRSGMTLEDAKNECSKAKERREFIANCEKYGYKASVIENRVKSGWTLEEALSGKYGKPYEIDGIRNTMKDWCDLYKITVPAVTYRMSKGMSLEEALTAEKKPGKPLKNFPKI